MFLPKAGSTHCLYLNILAHAVPLCLVSSEGPFGAVDTWLELDH